MARVNQFAKDLGISKNQAQALINKGRSRKDGGSQILESVMKPKKYKLGGSETNTKAPVAKVKIEKLMTQKDKADIKEKAEKLYRERNKPKRGPVKKPVKKTGKQSSGKQSSEKIIKDLQDFENTKSDITASTDREFSKKVFEANQKAMREAGETRKKANPISKRKAGGQENFGMLSVKAGVDKNPNATQADRIAGATMKKAKGGGIAIQGLGFTGVK